MKSSRQRIPSDCGVVTPYEAPCVRKEFLR